MRTPSEFEVQQLLAHVYDPVKAHEYYLRTRELKGRKKGRKEPSSKREQSKFVQDLAYVAEGGDPKVATKLLDWAKTKSDADIKAKIDEIKTRYGNQDFGMAYTLGQVLKNRDRVRKDKTATTQQKKESEAKVRQKKELQARIQNLEGKLKKLEELIRKKLHEEAAEDRKAKAKKERSLKEQDKPKSAAEKAKVARENKKYREKHKQELKTKAKRRSGSSGDSSASKAKSAAPSSSDLKALATKVKGQIAVAKQKLAAL